MSHDQVCPESTPTFGELGVPKPLLEELTTAGLTTPFPIQQATIPDALAGRDVLGCGRTGSGKTLAFGIPALARIGGGQARSRAPRALVLVPTRELAYQVRDAVLPYAQAMRVRVGDVVGGSSYSRQFNQLNRGVELLVATPGRLSDLIAQGACTLDDVRLAVLDEADQMCDLGFLPQVTELLDQIGSQAQTMLFSATLDGDVDTLVRSYLRDPVTHSVDPPVSQVATMDHHILKALPRDKDQMITEIAARQGRTLLFVRSKHRADTLSEHLVQSGVPAASLHGGKSQSVRTRTLEKFRQGRIQTLVATDVAARGIHVDGIDLVVNVDLPGSHKDYLHRGGRTARAGQSGRVVTIVTPRQRRQARRLLGDAGVTATAHLVNPGDRLLSEVTGAQEPSYIPWVEPPEPKPERTRGQRSRGGRPPHRHAGGRGRPAHRGSRSNPPASGRPRRSGTSGHPQRGG
ncbi:DEAD/DEAH box helicase [Lipingzhangella sp. LS1_29]|uniref:DEAD/DEAH box helicase n=1 Tax=Lipingzhangella rawalii TaxID=2055835 RepID=A0ABU2H1R6_9ACTN|nr:DEAD/DEAH box helicase [Lipingzhangella rawalii]MDS1269245.1 DEAD/DEAH box helicase [Lipingzhangella rawalii]